jgi:hypothetical protein
MIQTINRAVDTVFKREARLCPVHGAPGYPNQIRCMVCGALRTKLSGSTSTAFDSVPLNICMQCSTTGGPTLRCCGLDLE